MNIGDLIDKKYQIDREIGEGGMGKVYKVIRNDDSYAMKICIETDEESIRRFKREVRLMASIKHENVIEVLDMNLDHIPPYFVMPLCKFSLDSRLDRLQGNPQLVLKILFEVCHGITAIHSSEIVHRDIKPKNILISQDNTVKITDLGLGKFADRDSTILTSSNVYMGTQGYIPPEFFQVGGTKNADIKSDIYQLGKTIYSVFTNSSPLLIEKDRLPGGILYIVRKCISDNPANRYNSVGELENALSNYLLSLDPQNNPLNAFENYVNVAKDNLKNKTYDKENVEEIVRTLFTFKDDEEVFFNKFNKIPKSLLEILASNFTNLCTELLSIYIPTITKYFKEFRIDFSDAEDVANSMIKIFRGTPDIAIKVQAMEITLFASVYCNRYAAMEVFDAMLQGIKNDQDAVVIVEMLRANRDYYKEVANRVPPLRLNPLIQAIRNEVEAEKAEERARLQQEIDEMDY